MSKARLLADLLTSSGEVKADRVDAYSLPLTGGAMTGAVTTNSTFDGRNVSVDGSKLDAVEASADVTDTANVTTSGALMDSELTSIAAVKALNQGVATTDAVDFTGIDLTAISDTIAVTAVDVFIYDTSKDSDGGAWRKRTQGTSWYNEALNTSTRGSTKEFPAVAVIVATTGAVTIYDGDDPSMPMWMVFNVSSSSNMVGEVAITCVDALNGVLATGSGGAGYDLNVVRFLQDRGEQWGSPSLSQIYNGNISKRNSNKNWHGAGVLGSLVSRKINDIAMTVLPNAPIDSATGLPIPTIAVATDGGVSVIKDDGSVVSGGEANAGWAVRNITIDSNGTIWGSEGTSYSAFQLMAQVPYTSVSSIGTGSLGYPHTNSVNNNGYGANSSWPTLLGNIEVANNNFVASSDRIYTGFGGGVSHLVDNVADRTKSMVAYTASDYNTGYMVGDIKLAALSDTDTTDVVGSGTNIISGWTNHSTYPFETYTGSGLDITSAINTTSYGTLNTTYTPVIGRTYTVKFNLTLNSGTAPTFFGQSSSSVGSGPHGFVSVAGANSFTWTGTTAASSYVNLMVGNGVASNFSISGFTMYVGGEEDRSVNANGLAVHGTITKTAVATGADLVGYSGFSSSNYLEQPYNSDLDFGTGDFSIMGWVKIVTGATEYIFFRNTQGSVAGATRLYVNVQSTGAFYTKINNTAATSSATFTGWTHFTVLRVSGVVHIYGNGVLVASVANTNTATNTAAVTTIGSSPNGSNPMANSSLATIRISATAPSAQQIKDIYEAEKPLFQENAQATLYGSSDAVTALAHDDTTNLLHVGTSSGRSVFQGLRRVDNTTSAVGSAISASNNLVVEE